MDKFSPHLQVLGLILERFTNVHLQSVTVPSVKMPWYPTVSGHALPVALGLKEATLVIADALTIVAKMDRPRSANMVGVGKT